MSPRILAIDTTSDFGSLALLEGELLIEERQLHSTDGFSHVLFQELGALLDRHQWNLSSLDCIGCASGPGSFTGVRIGLTAAKGLAAMQALPMVTVSNLKAVASFGSQPVRAAILDARRGEIYGAVYSSSGELIQEETVMKFPQWLDQLPSLAIEFVSPETSLFVPRLEGTRWERAPFQEAPRHLAASIGRITAACYLSGHTVDPLAADANYVRRSDAELFWKEA